MAKLCIPKPTSEKLKKLFRDSDMNTEKLFKMTSKQRRKFFNEALENIDEAKEINKLFEKAMVSNQKQAMRRWVWKNLYDGKPLYVDITVQQSQAMKNAGLTMKQLRGLTPEERINKLTEFTDKPTARSLNKKYERLEKSGNLKNWEQRTLGTDKMFQDQKLKGSFSKIEQLDELGLLNPEESSKFMEDLVSSKLGADITAKEAKEISKLTKRVSEAFESVGNNWTFKNSDNVIDYFKKRKALEDFTESLVPSPALEVFTSVGARGAILLSLRSATNSFMFQVVPGITRSITKRIGSATLVPGKFGKITRFVTALRNSMLSKSELKMIKDQMKMAWKIYRKTGYDISRMQTLDDGMRFFGEKFTHTNGPSFKQAKGLKEKMGATVRTHARLVKPGLKYAAGGTDTVFANFHRMDTSILLSKTIADLESKAGKLPKGITKAQRKQQLIDDAMSFNPKTEQGKYIREMAIMDGHMANFTNNDGWGRLAIKIRRSLNLGDAKLGEALIPFLKIPANALGAGFEASGPGLITGAQRIIRGLRAPKGAERATAIAEGANRMIASGGLLGAATLLTSFLGPDDFIGAYDFKKRSENQLSLTKNAGSNYIRVGGSWYSTRWLGPLAVPVSAFMYARQAKAEGRSALSGYVQGIFWGMTQFPGLKELGEGFADFKRASEAETIEQQAKATGVDGQSLFDWAFVRTLPSFVKYDIMALGNETRYDAFGRPVPAKGDSVGSAVKGFFVGSKIKEDTSNEITEEFDRLLLSDNLPVLTNPSGEEEIIEKIGEDVYYEKLNEFKQNYAEKVELLIDTSFYKRMSDKEKKKEIDRIRRREILDKIKRL